LLTGKNAQNNQKVRQAIKHIKKALIFWIFTSGMAVVAVAGWSTTALGGGVYVCKGRDGGSHFTNTPSSADCEIFRMKRVSPFSGSSNRSSWDGAGKTMSYNGQVPYHSQIHNIGVRYRVDPNLIRAVIRTESSFNRYALSSKGAQGLMQLMPATAKEMKVVDPFDPHQNIEGGTRYLRLLMDTFNGDLTLTLAAYNAGPTLVRKVNRIPRIPETVKYVKRVLGHYKGYSRAQPMSNMINMSNNSTIRLHDVVTIQ
jgi:hypothetical protein